MAADWRLCLGEEGRAAGGRDKKTTSSPAFRSAGWISELVGVGSLCRTSARFPSFSIS